MCVHTLMHGINIVYSSTRNTPHLYYLTLQKKKKKHLNFHTVILDMVQYYKININKKHWKPSLIKDSGTHK